MATNHNHNHHNSKALEGKWHVKTVAGEAPNTPVQLHFDAGDLHYHYGNSHHQKYTTDGHHLKLGKWEMTESYSQGLKPDPTTFWKDVQRITRFEIHGNLLRLSDDDHDIFVLERL